MSDMTLEDRHGLPDALRVLMEEFPREDWSAHSRFHGLISFWLDRHLMFRRLLETLTDDSQLMLDGKMDFQKYQSRLSRFGGMFVGDLHGHHHIEDAHYFPILEKLDSRLENGFKILDADHHALDRHLQNFTQSANLVLQARPVQAGPDLVGGFNTSLMELKKLLDRHLVDEEELVVPVLLKHGTAGLE
ncbi:MAG: hemerythrin domain-containing protein [Hyphomicrobiales bacterium]